MTHGEPGPGHGGTDSLNLNRSGVSPAGFWRLRRFMAAGTRGGTRFLPTAACRSPRSEAQRF